MAAPVVGVPTKRLVAKFPTIPEPGIDVDSLQKSVLALKRAVEMLTGSDTKAIDGTLHNRFAPHVFVQDFAPTALHTGDLWLCVGGSYTFNIWDGTRWLVIATLPSIP
jgi:hypothetical protein